MRIDKFLSHAGVGSRKNCNGLIRKGSVVVNGLTVQNSSVHINAEKDRVEIEGKLVLY